MPTSDPRVIAPGVQVIIDLKPKSVLDIGVGFGKWGALAREYTDIWQGRFYQEEWETVIHGIEVHEKYRSPLWGVYDHVYIGQAENILATKFEKMRTSAWKYGLTIMMDVLEHFEKDMGRSIIRAVLDISSYFLVSWCNSEQKDVRDNKYEDHLSTWIVKDFEEMGVLKKVIKNEEHHLGNWGIVLLSHNKE